MISARPETAETKPARRSFRAFLWLGAFALLLFLVPYFLVSYYQHSRRVNRLSEAISHGSPDFDIISQLIRVPRQPFTGEIAEEVSQLDPPDQNEDEDVGNRMHQAGDEERQSVSVLFDDPADQRIEERRAEGPGRAEQALDGADDAGREEVGGKRLDVGRPELVTEERQTIEDDRE